jgi:hypothetical protein
MEHGTAQKIIRLANSRGEDLEVELTPEGCCLVLCTLMMFRITSNKFPSNYSAENTVSILIQITGHERMLTVPVLYLDRIRGSRRGGAWSGPIIQAGCFYP